MLYAYIVLHVDNAIAQAKNNNKTLHT